MFPRGGIVFPRDATGRPRVKAPSIAGNSDRCLAGLARAKSRPTWPRSELCNKMARRPWGTGGNPDRRGTLLPAQSGGRPVQLAPRRTVRPTRAEATSDTSRWLKRKLCPATSAQRRTTISMPNIISGRCPRTARIGRRWKVGLVSKHQPCSGWPDAPAHRPLNSAPTG